MIIKLDLINERKSIINPNRGRVSLDLDLVRLLKDLGMRNNFPLLISNSRLRKLNSNILIFSLDILVNLAKGNFEQCTTFLTTLLLLRNLLELFIPIYPPECSFQSIFKLQDNNISYFSVIIRFPYIFGQHTTYIQNLLPRSSGQDDRQTILPLGGALNFKIFSRELDHPIQREF